MGQVDRQPWNFPRETSAGLALNQGPRRGHGCGILAETAPSSLQLKEGVGHQVQGSWGPWFLSYCWVMLAASLPSPGLSLSSGVTGASAVPSL